MELKNALAVCLISLFSATLVVLIARSLDSQAASRLEPQLVRIVEELEAIRLSGGMAVSREAATKSQPVRDGLVVYYFHSNIRCPTCEAIESQAHAVVENDFGHELESGEVVWKTLNYEDSAVSDLAAEFEIQMPVVVLARLEEGRMEKWNRLDRVWGLVGDKPAFREYVGREIREMLKSADHESESVEPDEGPAIPLPDTNTDTEKDELPLPNPSNSQPSQ